MRISIAILAAAFALLCFGCGGDGAEVTAGETTSSEKPTFTFPPVADRDDPRFATITHDGGPRAEPEIDPPDGASPPEELLIRDLEVGSGRPARPGDTVVARYLGVEYQTGDGVYTGWSYPPTFELSLLRDGGAFEEGLWGVRPGGKRELVIPSRRAFQNGALDYYVEVVRIDPGSK